MEIIKIIFIKDLAYDEIFSTFLVNSEIRKKIKKIKKKKKFLIKKNKIIIKRLEFSLTNDQIKTLDEINKDLCSSKNVQIAYRVMLEVVKQ